MSSTTPCLQPSSSFLHTHPSFFSLNYFSLPFHHFSLPLHTLSRFLGHLTFLLLVCLPVFSPPFSLPSYPSITHFLCKMHYLFVFLCLSYNSQILANDKKLSCQ